MHTRNFLTLALTTLAAAAPINIRQTGISSNEFTQGGCREILFAWARGSTEEGNMGTVVGPKTSDGIKAVFGDANVATEGIEYAALLGTNVILGGTDHKSKELMANMLKTMHSKCPDSVIVAGGYSQGAAVSHRAIESLLPDVKAQIAGVILYGDTQRAQDLGRIRGFDKSKTKIICAEGDLVCWGTLIVLPPHLTYGNNAEEGAAFLNEKIKAALETKDKKAQARSEKEMHKLVTKSTVGVATRLTSS